MHCIGKSVLRAAVLLAAFFVPAAPPQARTWHVKADGSGDAPNIQAAVDSAAAGDSILAAAGKYWDTREILIDGVMKRVNLHLHKNVRVIGEDGADKTMIKAYSSDIGVYVAGVDSTAELSHFIIETSWRTYSCSDTLVGAPDAMPAAVDMRNSAALIGHNLIRYNDVGIRLSDASGRIIGNEIHHSIVSIHCREQTSAVISDNDLHDGMLLIECDQSSPVIDGNDLRKACIAIRTINDASPLIVNNLIHFTWNWAVVCRSVPLIEANQFIGNASAVYVSGGGGIPRLKWNLFYQNIFGVEIAPAQHAHIENNTFDACEFAVHCEANGGAVVRNNIIVRPGIGVSCNEGCSLDAECNNIFGALIERYGGICADLTGLNGNISVDPEFCGLADSGNYFLQSDSPCAEGNHPLGSTCGRIGAYAVNCETVPVEDTSWGAIKRIFSK